MSSTTNWTHNDIADIAENEGEVAYDLLSLKERISDWTKQLKDAADLCRKPGPASEPFKNVYAACGNISGVNFQVDACSNVHSIVSNPLLKFWVRFSKIHVLSSLAKWYEISEELSVAELHHVQCIEVIENELKNAESLENIISKVHISPQEEEYKDSAEELRRGKDRVKYMYIYELTRYAILCSERDNQAKALTLLKKAESFYHENSVNENLPPPDPNTILGMLDSLNAESSKEMFTYVLFYLGQAYKINAEKEKAILYLHSVLRRQLEKGDYNNITWGSDASRMASVLMINTQAYETAREMLVAATTVMKQTPEEETNSDNFRQNFADLGRTWVKFGVNLLEFSCDRLKDLEEDRISKEVKFESQLTFDKYEKMSLEINDDQPKYHTILLIRSLKFPDLDVSEVTELEMKGKFVRDFDDARAVFLPAQRWINISKEYYKLDEFASDYIDIMTDYASLFKHLTFFEPNLDRRIKMHKRRIAIIEELLSSLNSKVYTDVFYELLRELAETYEAVYKLKVDELKDRGKSLRVKDKKLVQWIVDAVGAHKKNLILFGFNLDQPEKSFPIEHEKVLMACVLSCGRMLGSICHDHPLHPDAAEFGEESKRFYQYFMNYLDRHLELKKEFYVLYQGSEDMPALLDSQIRKIHNHHRMRMTE